MLSEYHWWHQAFFFSAGENMKRILQLLWMKWGKHLLMYVFCKTVYLLNLCTSCMCSAKLLFLLCLIPRPRVSVLPSPPSRNYALQTKFSMSWKMPTATGTWGAIQTCWCFHTFYLILYHHSATFCACYMCLTALWRERERESLRTRHVEQHVTNTMLHTDSVYDGILQL